jgi:hypothetical protein
MMTRLVAWTMMLLSLAAMASCALGVRDVFMPEKAERDARIILQGMRSVPLRPGDTPVDINPE